MSRLPARSDELSQVSQDIRDELADHLATLAEATAAREGISATEAMTKAAAQFGDLDRLARRCWWIQQGDEVMKRVLVIGGCVLLLAVAAGFLMPAIAQLQSLSGKVDDLTEQLATLNSTQRKLLEQQAASAKSLLDQQKESMQSLSIRGKAYLGERSKPAKRAMIEVWRASDMSKVRTLKADDEGRFGTSYLPRDEYFLLAPLVGKGNPSTIVQERGTGFPQKEDWVSFFNVQSGPLFQSKSGTTATVDLDVRFPRGEITFELEPTLPDVVRGDRLGWTSRLSIAAFVLPGNVERLPNRDLGSPASLWPQRGYRGDWAAGQPMSPSALLGGRVDRFGHLIPGVKGDSSVSRERSSTRLEPWSWYFIRDLDLPEQIVFTPDSAVPPARYQVAVMLAVSPPPFFLPGKAFDPNEITLLEAQRPHSLGGITTVRRKLPQDLVEEQRRWQTSTGDMIDTRLSWRDVEVREGRRTHLKITIPDADKIVPTLQEVLDKPEPTDDDFRRAFAIRPAKVELVGHLPMLDPPQE